MQTVKKHFILIIDCIKMDICLASFQVNQGAGALVAPNVLAPIDFLMKSSCSSLSHCWTHSCHSYPNVFAWTHITLFFSLFTACEWTPIISYYTSSIKASSCLSRMLWSKPYFQQSTVLIQSMIFIHQYINLSYKVLGMILPIGLCVWSLFFLFMAVSVSSDFLLSSNPKHA